MMNQPFEHADRHGRSIAPAETRPTASRAPKPMTGSAWPICGGSMSPIVERDRFLCLRPESAARPKKKA